MADCTFNSGITRDCSRGIVGIEEVYIANATGSWTFTDVSGLITAITPTASFYTFQPNKETGNYTETQTMDVPGGIQMIEQNLTFKVSKQDTTTREGLVLLGTSEVYAIVKDTRGNYILLGRDRKLDVKVDYNSGTAFGDTANGYTVTIMGKANRFGNFVTGSIIDNLTI